MQEVYERLQRAKNSISSLEDEHSVLIKSKTRMEDQVRTTKSQMEDLIVCTPLYILFLLISFTFLSLSSLLCVTSSFLLSI